MSILTMSGILEAKPKVGYFYKGEETGPELNEALSIIVDKVKSVPVVIDEETTVYDAAVTMFLEDVGTIFVVKDNLLKGVISRKDLLKATLTGDSGANIPVSVVMTRLAKIVYCYKNDRFIEAVRKIVEYDVDCLPIVVEEGYNKLKVIGRISKTSISKYILELAKPNKE